jgi:hypothetical protein
VLLAMAVCYVSSGIIIRIGGLVRRWWHANRFPNRPRPEQQVG